MKAINIANKYKLHESAISKIRHGDRYTDNIDLAVDMARLTGRKPIVYIKKKLQKLALAAYPELNKKISA